MLGARALSGRPRSGAQAPIRLNGWRSMVIPVNKNARTKQLHACSAQGFSYLAHSWLSHSQPDWFLHGFRSRFGIAFGHFALFHMCHLHESGLEFTRSKKLLGAKGIATYRY